MDSLFKRYGSPFLLLDGYIACGQLASFVIDFWRAIDEDALWDIWLHKVEGKSFDQFLDETQPKIVNAPTQEQIAQIIQQSASIVKEL